MLMQSPAKRIKLESAQAVDSPAQLRTCNIVDLPTELVLQIISLLPVGSVRNLMVNRWLRSVCEQGLYQSISLGYHDRRSMRLLETFLLRPDLALLVRHLEICPILGALRLKGVGGLSLANNIRSFSLMGDPYWMWGSSHAELRKAVSKMKLVRLEIPILVDPHDESESNYEIWGYRRKDSHVDLGAHIRRLLQAQPFLEEIKFSDSAKMTSRSVASLQACLQPSDVPSLKSLQATPEVALAFLPIATRLESLDLMITDWDDRLLSEMKTKAAAIKLSIRRFVIGARSFARDRWLWSSLAKVFALFPNTEQLSVAIDSDYENGEDVTAVEPAVFYFKTIADNVHVLPSLREIEVRYHALHHYQTSGISEVETQTVVDFKTACPLLETVVDPEKRLWMFRSDRQSSRGFVPFLVGPLIWEDQSPMRDLPVPGERDS